MNKDYKPKTKKNQEPRKVSKTLRLIFAMNSGFPNTPRFESWIQSLKSTKVESLAEAPTPHIYRCKSGTPKSYILGVAVN